MNANDLSHTTYDDDRYARQRLIPSWQQESLKQATVLVGGAGALGNEVIKNLALLGIGRLIILDRDTIEVSNLSRTVLFRPLSVHRATYCDLPPCYSALSVGISSSSSSAGTSPAVAMTVLPIAFSISFINCCLRC
jgi:glutamyl-tRNA reductase